MYEWVYWTWSLAALVILTSENANSQEVAALQIEPRVPGAVTSEASITTLAVDDQSYHRNHDRNNMYNMRRLAINKQPGTVKEFVSRSMGKITDRLRRIGHPRPAVSSKNEGYDNEACVDTETPDYYETVGKHVNDGEKRPLPPIPRNTGEASENHVYADNRTEVVEMPSPISSSWFTGESMTIEVNEYMDMKTLIEEEKYYNLPNVHEPIGVKRDNVESDKHHTSALLSSTLDLAELGVQGLESTNESSYEFSHNYESINFDSNKDIYKKVRAVEPKADFTCYKQRAPDTKHLLTCAHLLCFGMRPINTLEATFRKYLYPFMNSRFNNPMYGSFNPELPEKHLHVDDKYKENLGKATKNETFLPNDNNYNIVTKINVPGIDYLNILEKEAPLEADLALFESNLVLKFLEQFRRYADVSGEGGIITMRNLLKVEDRPEFCIKLMLLYHNLVPFIFAWIGFFSEFQLYVGKKRGITPNDYERLEKADKLHELPKHLTRLSILTSPKFTQDLYISVRNIIEELLASFSGGPSKHNFTLEYKKFESTDSDRKQRLDSVMRRIPIDHNRLECIIFLLALVHTNYVWRYYDLAEVTGIGRSGIILEGQGPMLDAYHYFNRELFDETEMRKL